MKIDPKKRKKCFLAKLFFWIFAPKKDQEFILWVFLNVNFRLNIQSQKCSWFFSPPKWSILHFVFFDKCCIWREIQTYFKFNKFKGGISHKSKYHKKQESLFKQNFHQFDRFFDREIAQALAVLQVAVIVVVVGVILY